MTNRSELVTQLRFALHQLSARNGHHEFETICRELARARFTPNILPATGPVSSGGDQGRDFENYQTRIRLPLGDTALLLGLSGTELTAFACTLQQAGIDSKIREDVATICSGGEHVEVVVAFCEANVPIARRHALQASAREDWNVRLEVFDGYAIADQLADRDVFWIAEQYLSLPSAIVPEIEHDPGEYEAKLSRWRNRQRPPRSLGDYLELQDGLRHATFNREARADVSFWLERMRLLNEDELPTSIRQRARYEVVLGALRGLGHLRGEEATLREHLTYAADADEPATLEDATVLLLSASGAWAMGLTDMSSDELLSWNSRLRARAGRMLDSDPIPSRRAVLLDILGTLNAQPDVGQAQPRDTPTVFDFESLERLARIREGSYAPTLTSVPLIDRASAMAHWLELTQLLSDVPLYPVDTLATRIALIAPLISDEAGYPTMTALLDEAVARTAGRAAAAERCRDRALAQRRSGNLIEALREFHRARVDWFAGDTLRGSLLAQHLIADCYYELELPLAAKYSWLAASYLVGQRDELTDLVPPSLFGAAACDFATGAWLGASEVLGLAFLAQAALAENPWNPERYRYLNSALYQWSVIEAYASRAGEPASTIIRDSIAHAGADEIIREAVEHGAWWTDLSDAELSQRVSEEIGHPAFADAGTRRTLRWCALGIEWKLTFATDYETTLAAERLAAIMQMICAELADVELCLLRTRIDMEVSLDSGDDSPVEALPSNEGRRWRVSVKRFFGDQTPAVGTHFQDAISIMVIVLFEASLISQDQLLARVEEAYRRGLADRFSPGLLYDQTFPIDPEKFAASQRSQARALGSMSASQAEHNQLKWRSDLGPGYSPEQGQADAARRYSELERLLPHSLERLCSDRDFRRLTVVLRQEGWKDWHILQAATSILFSYRTFIAGHSANPDAMQQEARRMASEPESSTDPFPPMDSFTQPSMSSALQVSMLVTLRGWDLELHQDTPDFPAIEDFLAVRYRFWEDDAPHDPLPDAA